jgi:integrase
MARPPLPIGTWGVIRRTGSAGRWTAYARFRDYDGHTRIVERSSTRSGAEAERILRAALIERSRTEGDDITGETTLSALAQKWFSDEIDGRKALNTERRYFEVLRDFVLPGLGGVRIREASTQRLDSFLRIITAKSGPGTAKIAKTVLTGMLGMAARFGAIESNPIRDVGLVEQIRKPVEVLNLEQMRAFRAFIAAHPLAIETDIVDVIDFLLGTGVRIGEGLAMQWPSITLVGKPTADVVAKTQWVKGVGMTLDEMLKTDSARRSLVLPAFTARMLADRDRHPSGLVFPSVNGKVRDPSNVRRVLNKVTKDTEWEWVEPHTFRKSVATLVKDLDAASKQLGHAGTGVTEKHYRKRLHEAPDLRAELDAIGEPSNTHRKQRASIGEHRATAG